MPGRWERVDLADLADRLARLDTDQRAEQETARLAAQADNRARRKRRAESRKREDPRPEV